MAADADAVVKAVPELATSRIQAGRSLPPRRLAARPRKAGRYAIGSTPSAAPLKRRTPPLDVVAATRERYLDAFRRVMGVEVDVAASG
jgi:hypothetical protein